MKNKIINKFIMAILAVFTCTANFAYAVSLPHHAKSIAAKFSLAMFGVALFSVMIFVGLSLYNKFFVSSQIKDFKLKRDSLQTPQDKDEAIITFITKNRLK